MIRKHGISGKTLEWIKDWLEGRTQWVSINGTKSMEGKVTSGVPQGSILGPLLFIMYINTMDKDLFGLVDIISKFADDTKVGTVVKTDQQKDSMKTALNRLETWANDWQMSYNEAKCKVVHFGKNNMEEKYTLNNVTLEKSDQEKDIGVINHQTLKPSAQCLKAAGTANNVLGQMSRALHVRDFNTWSRP